VLEIAAFDGTRKTILSSAVPLRDAAGALEGALVINEDITALGATEAALRRSEAEYRALFELAGVAKTEADLASGRYLRINSRYCEFTGYEAAELLEMSLSDLIYPEDRADNEARIARALGGDHSTVTFERRYRRKDGATAWGLVSLAFVAGADGRLRSLATIQDITARKRAEQRDRLLAQAGELLGASLDVAAALQAITDLLVPTFADWCVVSTIEEGWVVRRAARHVAPEGEAFLRALRPRYALEEDPGRGVARIIATGDSFFRPEGSLVEETLPDDPDLQQRLARGVPGAVSQIVVPMTARGRVLGAINACLGPGTRRFDRDDLSLLEELGRHAALALDNARLFAAERAAREAAERATARATRLQVATAALSTAVTPDDVARVAVEAFMAALGAVGCAVALVRPGDEQLELRHAVGFPAEVMTHWRLYPLDQPSPRAVVARTGEPIWLDSPEEAARRFPDSAFPSLSAVGQHSWAVVPLVVGGTVLGSLLFSFDRPAALDEADRALSQALGGLCAQAIERARLYEAERSTSLRLQQILEVLPEAVLVVDGAGRFALANGAAVSALGLDPVGQALPVGEDDAFRTFGTRKLDGSPYPDRELPLERAVLLGETTRGEQMILRNASTGADLPVLVSAAPLRDASGAIAGGLAAFQDITALKALERIRDDFYAAVSHDLKNPLTIIRAHTQLVQRQVGKLDPALAAPLVERLGTVIGATSRMNQLLNDLLDHARLQSGEQLDLVPQPTDLIALLHRLAAEWDRLNDQHHFVVETEGEALTAPVDPRRFERVLENLLSNAVKYSPPGGRVALAAWPEVAEGRDWVVVAVRDSGIGIPASDLPYVFEPYRRGGNVRGRVSGTGLGLANARRLIEQHGGTIAIASVEGEGTSVAIRLPVS
jgi:PAS domain S-box-containing protein